MITTSTRGPSIELHLVVPRGNTQEIGFRPRS